MRIILLFLTLYNCYVPTYSMETTNTLYNTSYSLLNDLFQAMDPNGQTILDEHFSNIKLYPNNDSSVPSHWQSPSKTNKTFNEDTSGYTELKKLSEQVCAIITSCKNSNKEYSNNLNNTFNLLLDEYHKTLQNGIIAFREKQDTRFIFFYSTKLCNLLSDLGNMLEHFEPRKNLDHIYNLYSIIGQTATTVMKTQDNLDIKLREKINQLIHKPNKIPQSSIETFKFIQNCILLNNIVTMNKALQLRELSFAAIRISAGKYSHALHAEVVAKDTLTDQGKHFREILCNITQLHKIHDLYSIIGQICIIEQYNNIMTQMVQMYEQNSEPNNNTTVECTLF